jgi:putative transposase
MKRGQRPSAEEVVLILRHIEVQMIQGKILTLACKDTQIYAQTYNPESNIAAQIILKDPSS